MYEDESSEHWSPGKPPDAQSGLWKLAWSVLGVMFFFIVSRGCDFF